MGEGFRNRAVFRAVKNSELDGEGSINPFGSKISLACLVVLERSLVSFVRLLLRVRELLLKAISQAFPRHLQHPSLQGHRHEFFKIHLGLNGLFLDHLRVVECLAACLLILVFLVFPIVLLGCEAHLLPQTVKTTFQFFVLHRLDVMRGGVRAVGVNGTQHVAELHLTRHPFAVLVKPFTVSIEGDLRGKV